MKHKTADELATQHETSGEDVVGVFDEEAMVIEQSRYRAEEAEREGARTHSEDEFYYIISGSGRMRVGNETSEVNPGDVIYVDEGVEHDFFDIDGEIRTVKVFASP